MFVGTHERQLDDKGRLALPAPFRNQLGEHCYLAKGMDKCIEVIPAETFERDALETMEAVKRGVASRNTRRTLAGTDASHLSLTGAQLLLATVQLAVVTPLFTEVPSDFPVLPLLAVVALGALGTGLAMLVQYSLVAEVGPTTAQMVTYFIPVIATAAGVAILDEPLAWSTPVGAVVVVAGAALTQSRARA